MDAHAMSVITNSCVSLPRNPRTKLAASFHERTSRNGDSSESETESEKCGWNEENMNSWRAKPGVMFTPGKLNGDNDRTGELEGWDESWGEREAELLASFDSDNGYLSNEEFFSKLQDARKSHRENLKLLEQAYNEKLRMNQTTPSLQVQAPRSGMTTGNREGSMPIRGTSPSAPYVTDHSVYHIPDKLEEMRRSKPSWLALQSEIPKDSVRDMSAHKPPSGRPKRAWHTGGISSLTSSTKSSLPFKNEWSDITWTSDSDMDASSQSTKQSRKYEQTTNSTLSLSKQPDSPAVIVDNMWDDFSVEGYAPRARNESRLSSRSTTGAGGNIKSQRMEWSPKITIPKPFQMMKREALKEKTVSRASVEIDEEIRRRQIEEEAECQKQFKAKPVPATTFIPLYEDLKERQIERSREIRLQSKQKLKEMQKPFDFEKREEKRKTGSQKTATPPPKHSRTPKFKARKVPKSIFDPSVDQRILEEEEYRKIRMKMRSEEMLRSSSLPPNMEVMSKHYTDGKQRRKNMKKKEKHAFFTDEHKFHPQINGVIPDYEEQYRKFQEEVRMRKQEKEPTVVEPFNLRTARIPSKRDKILAELQAEEDRRKEEMKGYHTLRSSRALSTSVEDVLPIKTTSSSILRKSLTDKTRLERAEQERLLEEKERQKRVKQQSLRQAVSKKAKANDASQSLESTSREKLKQYRKSEKAREKEYQKELEEMMARVESRPLLFERESQHNAQKRAERQYIDALRTAGLDEVFLERKSHSPRGRSVKVTKEEPHESESSDEDLAVLKQQTSEDHHSTYDVDYQSNGSYSSDDDEGSAT